MNLWSFSPHQLVENLFKNGLLKSSRVLDAMKKVDRANYLPTNLRSQAYADRPQSIGFGATISAPHMHANALENLLPLLVPGARVLGKLIRLNRFDLIATRFIATCGWSQ